MSCCDADRRRGLDRFGVAYAGLGSGEPHGRNSRFFRRWLPLPAGRVPVFGRGRGAAGSCHRARALAHVIAVETGVRVHRAADWRGRSAADRVLRVRIAFARPFTEQGFRAFNESYVVTLQKWGLFDGKVNPVARSNVCPEIDPPPEPCFYAFSFTAAADAAPSFVIAGSAETREGGGSYGERTIRRGESSSEAMREKARYVLGEMERRLAVLGLG